MTDHLMADGCLTSDGRLTILLVEDSRLFSSVLAFRFQNELGLHVHHCASLGDLQAALAVPSNSFALAMVDLNLPGSPRGEVLNLTLAGNIPTVVFTGSVDPDTRAAIMQRHVIDYVMKDNDLALEKAFSAVRQALLNRETKALVVHASEANRGIAAQILRRMLFQVEEASEGWAAIAMLEKDAYPLVVIGEDVSDMTGPDLTRRIRKQHPATQLALIGLYAESDNLNGLHFLRNGASDAVRLPVMQEEFQARVVYHMDLLGEVSSLRAAAASDYLTGLYNRRYFFAEGPKLIGRCLKKGEPVSVGVLDIDHFKRLNDTYGHEIGDLVLVAVAKRLKQEVEGSGHLLCRLGGEEFSVLSIGLDGRDAAIFFDELRRRIATVKVVADEEELSVSVSIGVAEVKGYETFDNYINAADQFLYMAKHRGRNQVFSDHLMAVETAEPCRAAS